MFKLLMEGLAKLRHSEDQRNAREYETLVRYAAELTGKPPAKRVEETERMLSKHGITPAQFQADVARYQEMRRLEPLAAKRHELRERYSDLKDELNAFEAAFVKARKQFLHDRAKRISHRFDESRTARRQGRSSARRSDSRRASQAAWLHDWAIRQKSSRRS